MCLCILCVLTVEFSRFACEILRIMNKCNYLQVVRHSGHMVVVERSILVSLLVLLVLLVHWFGCNCLQQWLTRDRCVFMLLMHEWFSLFVFVIQHLLASNVSQPTRVR